MKKSEGRGGVGLRPVTQATSLRLKMHDGLSEGYLGGPTTVGRSLWLTDVTFSSATQPKLIILGL